MFGSRHVRLHWPPTIPASREPASPTSSPMPIAAWPSGEIGTAQHLAIARGVRQGRDRRAGDRRPGHPRPTAASLRPDRLAGPRRPASAGSARTDSWPCPMAPTVRAPRFDRAPAWTSTDHRWTPGNGPTRRPSSPSSRSSSGPYTLARLAEPGARRADPLALGLAEAMNAELRALAAAGCPIIQVDEGALATIGDDAAEWALYAATQQRLTAGLEEHHLSLGHLPRGDPPGGPRQRPRRPVPELPRGRAWPVRTPGGSCSPCRPSAA